MVPSGSWPGAGFGAGLSPLAPETAGALYWLKSIHLQLFLAAIALGLVVGVYVCSRVNHDFSRNDHPAVVWDEVVGYWIAMFGTPLLAIRAGRFCVVSPAQYLETRTDRLDRARG